ncbi:hypothetical protein AYL44_12580 [Microbacterium oleivorans]|uniref:DUF2975 domain-containing protein n=2 Tax=Microbacterium oleivorans TaxID=273677 RepID=A0A177K621_9MICO|nr:hypothetical protein AYL44_12580 [Microbacterium oleivorans]
MSLWGDAGMVSWTDWQGALIYTAILLAVVAAIVGAQIWDARRRKSPSVILDVVASMGRIWVAAALLGTVFLAVRWIWVDWAEVDIPISGFWPTALPCDLEGNGASAATGPALSCARMQIVDANVVGLDGGSRWLLGIGQTLTTAVIAVPGWLVADLAQRAVKGRPFVSGASRWLMVGAITVLVAGSLGSVLTDVGSALLAQSLFPPSGADGGITAPYTVGFAIPLWPAGVALGLAALSVIFRQGARLQRETEGLV